MHILFLCTGNSCRSQMAEGWMRHLGEELAPELNLEVSSAGLEAHGVNPRAVTCMQQQGVDISGHSSDVLTDKMLADANLIVTVCSHADANCPLVPPTLEKRHIPFDDPAKATGSEQEITDCFNRVCEEIRQSLHHLILELKEKAA